LRKQFHECSRYLIQFNLLYKFLQNIEFDYVQHLFLTVFGCSEHIRDFDILAIGKVLQYCKFTSFFVDLANAILLGPGDLDAKKFDIEYKPTGIGPLLRSPNEEITFFFNAEERPISYGIQLKEDYFIEESKGFIIDIDYLQPVFRAKNKTDFKKLKSLKTSSSVLGKETIPQNIEKPRRYIKAYPSLLEKNSDVIQDNQPINLNEKENESIDDVQSSNTPSSKLRHRNSKSLAFPQGNSKPNLFPERKDVLLKITKEKGNNLSQALFSKTPKRETHITLKNLNSPSQTPRKHKDSSALGFATPNSVRGNNRTNLPKIEANFKNQLSTGNYNLDVLGTFRNYTSQANTPRKNQFLNDKKAQNLIAEPIGPINKANSYLNKRSNSTSQLDFDQNQRESSKDGKAPIKVTVARELSIDTLEKSDLKQLNKLYPLSSKDIIQKELDIEAKKIEFTVSNIKENETFSLPACEMLREVVRKAFSTPFKEEKIGKDDTKEEEGNSRQYELKKKIGISEIDYTEFWNIFLENKCKVFEIILKVDFITLFLKN